MLRLLVGRVNKFAGNLNLYLDLDKDSERVSPKWVRSMRTATLKRLETDVEDMDWIARQIVALIEAELPPID